MADVMHYLTIRKERISAMFSSAAKVEFLYEECFRARPPHPWAEWIAPRIERGNHGPDHEKQSQKAQHRQHNLPQQIVTSAS